jgi:hypothetical protein
MEAGLDTDQAQPVQAGLTMADQRLAREAQYNQARQSGMDHRSAMDAVYGQGPTAQTMAEADDGIGPIGMISAGGRQLAADTVMGGARMLGYGDMPEINNLAQRLGPSQETQQQIAERFAERQAEVDSGDRSWWSGVLGDAGDAALLSAAQLPLSIGGAGAGRALVRPVASRVPAAIAKPVQRAGELAGVAATSAPQLYESGYQTAIENGLDPNDPTVQNQIAARTIAGVLLESVTPMSILNRWTNGRAGRAFGESVFRGGLRGLAVEAANEGVTEALDVALEAFALDPRLQQSLSEGEYSEMMEYFGQRYGRDMLVGGLSGSMIGGPAGFPAGLNQTALQNQRDRQDIRRLQETLVATDLTPEVVEQQARAPGGASRVRAAASRLAKADMLRFTEERNATRVPPPEDLARPGGVERYRRTVRRQQEAALKAQVRYEAERDRVAKAFGAQQMPSEAIAKDRLRQVGIQVGDNMPGQRARVMAAELDVSRKVVDALKAAEQTATDPDVKKVIASEAINAERQYRATRVRAAAEAKGVPVGEIEAEMARQEEADRQRAAADEYQARLQAATEQSRMRAEAAQAAAAETGRPTQYEGALGNRLREIDEQLGQLYLQADQAVSPEQSADIEAQVAALEGERTDTFMRMEAENALGSRPDGDKREAAIEKQMAVEFPETMAPEQRVARAQEIVAEFEADPDGNQRGLIDKIKRLQRQRRAATDPATIDRLNSEIAALEARRGLPTPAVEAARRVLQAQERGPDVPTGIKAPTAQEPSVDAGESRAADPAQGAPNGQTTASTDAPPAQRAADSDTGERENERRRRAAARGRSIMPETPIEGMEAAEAELLRFTGETGFEAAAFVRPDGTVISMVTDSTPGGVSVPVEGRADPDAIFTHTHTLQTPFSAADVNVMMKEVPKGTLRTMRAILPDGETLEMRPISHLNEEEIGSISSLLVDHVERTIRLSPAGGPLKGDALQVIRLRQESLLQALDGAGVISYTSRLKGLTAAEQEVINGAIERARPLLDPLRARGVDGEGPEGSGSPGRRAGRSRAGIEEQASEIAARIAKRERSTANPERIDQLADEMMAYWNRKHGPGRPSKLRDLMKSTGLEREGVRRGIEMAVREQGNKASYALFNTAKAMYPDMNWKDMPREKVRDPDDKRIFPHGSNKKHRMISVPTREYRDAMTSAAWLINDIGRMGHGHFYRRINSLMNERGQLYKTFFHMWAPKLRDFADMSVPPDAQFFPALENPDDTTKIKRSGDTRILSEAESEGDPDAEDFDEDADAFEVTTSGDNKFSMSAIEPARRTARYLQANKYTIDEQYLATVQPKDMLSKKGLGQAGIEPADVELFLRMENEGYVPQGEEAERMHEKRVRRIREKLRMAETELERFRAAAKAYRKENGRKPIGFVYRVDDKGRIYADGQFTPQSTEAVKYAFKADGKSLAKMSTVDASASGWQVAALIARDEQVADNVNLTPGRGKEKGAPKRDMYTEVISDIEAGIERDANDPSSPNHKAATLFRDVLVNSRQRDGSTKSRITRNMLKTSVIAVNYGAKKGKFTDSFRKAFGHDIRVAGGKLVNGKMVLGKATPHEKMWSYLGGLAYDSLQARAPATMAFQNWALTNLETIIGMVEGNKPGKTPNMTFSVGVDGDFQRRRNTKDEVHIRVRPNNGYDIKQDENGKVEFKDGDIIKTRDNKEDHTSMKVDYGTMDVDAAGTARSIYSQMIQAFDAAILHRSIERYKQVTGGAFITTNHDAFTVPKEHEGAINAAVAESMATVLGNVDVPRRLYDEIMDIAQREYQKGNLTDADMETIRKKVQPFTGYGKYNVADVATASPVFVEIDRKDVVPDWTDLPGEGADLMKASDVNVARYMEQLPQTSKAMQAVQNAITNPSVTTRTLTEAFGDYVFNQFNPIARLERQVNEAKGKGRVLHVGMDSAFKAAEIAINDSGRNEALLHAGAAAWGRNGEYSIANGTTGLYDIFRIAGGGGPDRGQRLQDWMQWMVARRAEDLMAKGIKVPVTAAEIAAAKAKHIPDFDRAAKAWRDFNDANLDFLEQSGRISKQQKAAMQADAFYVPFYRADERIDGTSPELDLSDLKPGGFSSANGLLSRDPGIKKMIGGDKMQIQNLMVNMIRNSQAMVAAGMRNNAANKVMDLMHEAQMAKFAPGSHQKPNVNAVRIWRKGVEGWMIPQTAEARPVMIAMAGFGPVQYTAIGRWFNGLSSIFRQSVTLSLPFMIRNAIRGTVSAGLLTSGSNLTLQNNALTGFVGALNNSSATQAFKAISGMGDYRFGGEDIGLGKNDMLIDFGLMAKGFDLRTGGYQIRKLLDSFEAVGMATEYADRIATYKTMIENGVRPDEAAYQALTIMNYGRKGAASWLKHFLPMVPFLNARLQGLSRMAEGSVNKLSTPEDKKKAAVRLAVNGAILATFSLAAVGFIASDDEWWDRYMAEPLHRRLSYYIFYVGDTTVLIPKPFELGHIFSTAPEFFAIEAVSAASGDAQTQEDNELMRALRTMFVDTVAFSAIPQFMKPAIEVSTNHSFFRQAPIDAAREARLAPADRVANASPLARFLLAGSDGRPGASEYIGISPSRMEALMEGYGGIFYSMLQTGFSIMAADMGIAPHKASPVFGDIPLATPIMEASLGWAFKDADFISERFSEDFYSIGRSVEQTYLSARDAALNGHLDRARRMAARVPGLESQYRIFTSVRDDLGEINRELRRIQNDNDMSRREKEAAERPLREARNRLTQRAVRAMQEIERRAAATP